jgi:diadenylate cyclase
MEPLLDLFDGVRLGPNAPLDIALTAVLIYGVFSLIQGTRAVRLVVGAILLYLIFVMAQALDLVLLATIMQTGAVVGLVALVVIFQPELRRGLDRLGRVGSLRWLGPSDAASHQRVAAILATAATALSKRRVGALVVVERDTGLGDMADTGVPLDAILSVDLMTSLFEPGSALHDGAVVVSGDKIVAAGVMLPLADRRGTKERYGTRRRAAIGVTEQTDALAIVVSEETGAISLAESGGIMREQREEDLRRRLFSLLSPADVRGTARSMASRRGRKAKAEQKDAGPAADAAVEAAGVDGAAAPADETRGEADAVLPATASDKAATSQGSMAAPE